MGEFIATDRYLKDGVWVSVGSVVEENDAAPEGAVSETDGLQTGADDRSIARGAEAMQVSAADERRALRAVQAAQTDDGDLASPKLKPTENAGDGSAGGEGQGGEGEDDLDKLTKDELVARAKERGIEVKAGDTKADIIEKLKA